MKIWDPIMGKGVGMRILSSHAERRRFKSIKKKDKKKFVSKSKEGWWATYSWRDRVGS